MVGSYNVRVSRRRGVSFRFTIRRNITVVRGDSGTGKTTLFEMVSDHMREGAKSGVTIQCDHPCVALVDMDWENQLAGMKNSIVFVDEAFRPFDPMSSRAPSSIPATILCCSRARYLPTSLIALTRFIVSRRAVSTIRLCRYTSMMMRTGIMSSFVPSQSAILTCSLLRTPKRDFSFLMPDSKRVMFRFSPRARTQRCLNGSIGTKAIVSLSSPMAPPLVRMRTGCLRFSISIGTLWRCACRNRSNGSCSNLGS